VGFREKEKMILHASRRRKETNFRAHELALPSLVYPLVTNVTLNSAQKFEKGHHMIPYADSPMSC
jgi:hypothetical protein